MRFPPFSDLDREQRRIYGDAPTDGAILVVGPPGTGKTVMAYHRAQKVKELNQAPTVIMFNRVLRRYTESRGEVASGVASETMHRWLFGWWKGKLKKRGNPPYLDGNRFDYNWANLQAEAIQAIAQEDGDVNRLSWGHLLIDEGQDFPQQMYLALGMIQNELSKKGVTAQLTVFADDNQRLNAKINSRIRDIRRFLFLENESSRNFALRKNYRNTRPIAEFCSRFQVGNESGIAELPDTGGQLPQVYFSENDRQIADLIVRKAKASPGKQIGVIVEGTTKHVKRAFNQLHSRIDSLENAPRIQMYLSTSEEHNADDLEFEKGNTITVLHPNSAKGLEFDIVFFLGLERMEVATSGFHNERMLLYVMCSRARSELILTFSDIDPEKVLPPSIGLLPRPSLGLCRYLGLGLLSERTSLIVQQLEGQPDQNSELARSE